MALLTNDTKKMMSNLGGGEQPSLLGADTTMQISSKPGAYATKPPVYDGGPVPGDDGGSKPPPDGGGTTRPPPVYDTKPPATEPPPEHDPPPPPNEDTIPPDTVPPADPNVERGANLWGVETLFGRRGMHRIYGNAAGVASGRGDTGTGTPLPDARPVDNTDGDGGGGGGTGGSGGSGGTGGTGTGGGGGGAFGYYGHPPGSDPNDPNAKPGDDKPGTLPLGGGDPTVVGSQAWMTAQLNSELLGWDVAMNGIFGGTPPRDRVEAYAMIEEMSDSIAADINEWYQAGNFDQESYNAAMRRLQDQEDLWKSQYWDWQQGQPDGSGPTNTGSGGGATPDPTVDQSNEGIGTSFLHNVLRPFESTVYDALGLSFEDVTSGALEPGQLKWLMGQYAQNNNLSGSDWRAYRQVFNEIYGQRDGYFQSVSSTPISRWDLPSSGGSGTNPNLPDIGDGGR